jgi:hypothetical protein
MTKKHGAQQQGHQINKPQQITTRPSISGQHNLGAQASSQPPLRPKPKQ